MIVVMFHLGFCLFHVDRAAAYSEQDPMILKCGIATPPNDMESRTINRLGDLVEERTNGRIKFKYFFGGSLIKKPQFADAVARGIADISSGPASFLTGKIPELSVFELYGSYSLDNYREMAQAVEPVLREIFAKRGVYIPYQFYSGGAIFCHKKKFLKTPQDWQGQKLRVPGRWLSTLAKGWGASTVFMAPAELYIALQRGVIDGYALIYDIVNGLKLYEVSPYIVETGLSFNISIETMNLKKWNSLTKEDQKIFDQACQEVIEWNYDFTLKHYDTLKKDIQSKGAKIYYLTPEQRKLFVKDTYALYPEVRKISGPLGNKLIDILEDFRIK
jgi:TRAP-type C4-dicarboxylate transport system substrate-binding protein